jgi:hypothetical protein
MQLRTNIKWLVNYILKRTSCCSDLKGIMDPFQGLWRSLPDVEKQGCRSLGAPGWGSQPDLSGWRHYSWHVRDSWERPRSSSTKLKIKNTVLVLGTRMGDFHRLRFNKYLPSFFCKQVFHSVAQGGLKLTNYPGLASNLRSSWLSCHLSFQVRCIHTK